MRLYRLDGTGVEEECERARDLARNALSALGYHDGVFHMELLLDSATDTLYFSECGARRGGGMIQEEVFAKYGYSLAGAAVDVAVGHPVLRAGLVDDRHVGTVYLYLPPGTIVRLPDPGRFVEPDYVYALHISALLGTNQAPAVRTTSYQQAMCVVSASSAVELEARMTWAQEEFAEQSLVAPTFGTKAQQRAFMASYEDAWRKLL
jgi:hypothetical protein